MSISTTATDDAGIHLRGNSAGSTQGETADLLAGSIEEGARVVRAMADARALLASVVTGVATA